MNLLDFYVHVIAPSEEAAEALKPTLGPSHILCCDPTVCKGAEHAPLVLIVGWECRSTAVCATVRAQTHSPIVLIVEDASHHAVIQGLSAGADLVLPRQSDAGELKARVRALIRRSQMPSPVDSYRLLRYSMS